MLKGLGGDNALGAFLMLECVEKNIFSAKMNSRLLSFYEGLPIMEAV